MSKKCKKSNISSQSSTLLADDNRTFICKKLPTWATDEGIVFPTRLSLEQCSGEKAAQYKGELVKRLFPQGGESMADLTGGLGVDFSFAARNFKKAFYIERQAALCEAARNNFPRIGLNNAEIIEGDGIDFLKNTEPVDFIFIDPARRDNAGRKTVLIEDCEPDVLSFLPLLWQKTKCIVLKLSPMLDLNRAIKGLGCVSETHIVADGGECKELLLVLKPEAENTNIYCVDGQQQFIFTTEEETAAIPTYTSEIKDYIYEPCTAILKAGAFKLVAQRFQLEKLHPNSHLYTSDQFVENFPGRSFSVKQVSTFSKKDLRDLCKSVEKANLTIRNFPGSVAELRKRLKLKEGVDAYWFATTLANEKHVIIDTRKAINQ